LEAICFEGQYTGAFSVAQKVYDDLLGDELQPTNAFRIVKLWSAYPPGLSSYLFLHSFCSFSYMVRCTALCASQWMQ
jgi:hypothetical protein